jgi:hypothetical protein
VGANPFGARSKEYLMSLPPLTRGGDLPLGVHPASLREVLDCFGAGSRKRAAVAGRLERVYRLALDTGHLARFVVMEDTFDGAKLQGEAALLFDHTAADVHFGASVFWVRRLGALGGEQTAIEYWQATRGGGQRGIVEIVRETP